MYALFCYRDLKLGLFLCKAPHFEWMCNSICVKTKGGSAALMIDRSALCVLVKPSDFWCDCGFFFPKWRYKKKKKSSPLSRFFCVHVKTFNSFVSVTPVKHSEPASSTACDQKILSGPGVQPWWCSDEHMGAMSQYVRKETHVHVYVHLSVFSHHTNNI